uniref:RBR-type E3 ubiquitin transferase n=1 Tax=Seriola lalandi dorsalis TaxID=1841481 RepID=A0A3B4YH63_SERLL
HTHTVASCSWSLLLDEHLEECPLCLLSQPRCHFPRLTSCSHRACSDCLRQYLRIEISESRVGIACPQCPETLAPLDVRAILDDRALLERFEEYQLRRFLAADPDTRWCPAPDSYGCAECPKLSCGREGCDTEFCYHCRQLWHPNQTCDQARRQRARHTSDAEEIKACPRCGAYIMKTNDGSCNRMNCTVCACQFCWLCMQEITDVHYLRCRVHSQLMITLTCTTKLFSFGLSIKTGDPSAVNTLSIPQLLCQKLSIMSCQCTNCEEICLAGAFKEASAIKFREPCVHSLCCPK